jgi:hypothetical protein
MSLALHLLGFPTLFALLGLAYARGFCGWVSLTTVGLVVLITVWDTRTWPHQSLWIERALGGCAFVAIFLRDPQVRRILSSKGGR